MRVSWTDLETMANVKVLVLNSSFSDLFILQYTAAIAIHCNRYYNNFVLKYCM